MSIAESEDPMLEFYGRHAVAPVVQNIEDRKRHFERRAALYCQLGIAPGLVRGKRVLEVGPGTGHNSIYTHSLEPSEYLLVDGNKTSRNLLLELFAKEKISAESFRLVDSKIEDLQVSELGTFDLVLCEAVLGGIRRPVPVAAKLCHFVKKGGVLVITSMDAVSTFAENVRRFLAYRLLGPGFKRTPDQVQVLLPALLPHIETLKGMSRVKQDWIVDNILLPLGSGYNLAPITEIVKALPPGFQILSSSPRFSRDWRWYKSITAEDFQFNEVVAAEYRANLHNLIDYRFVFPPRNDEVNTKLYERCAAFWRLLESYERTSEGVPELVACLREIEPMVADFSPESAKALREALDLLGRDKITAEGIAKSTNMARFFGRNLTYVSIVRLD